MLCLVLKHMLHVGRAEFCDASKSCSTSGPLYIDYTFLRLGYTYNYNHNYASLRYATLGSTSLHYPTLHYSRPLHLYNTSANAQLHHTTTTTPLRYNYNCSCTTPHYIQQLRDHCNHCNHPKKHNSNHLSVHQRIRSAIRESQQPTSPIGFLF